MCAFKIFYHKSTIPSNQSNCKYFIFGAMRDGADMISQSLFNKITVFSAWWTVQPYNKLGNLMMTGAWFHIYSKNWSEGTGAHSSILHTLARAEGPWPSAPLTTLSSGHTGSPLGIKWLNWDGDQGQEKKPLTGLTLNPTWHFYSFLCQEKQQDSLDTTWALLPSAYTVATLQPCLGPCRSRAVTALKPPVGFLCQGRKYLPTHRRHKAIYALFVPSCDLFSLK